MKVNKFLMQRCMNFVPVTLCTQRKVCSFRTVSRQRGLCSFFASIFPPLKCWIHPQLYNVKHKMFHKHQISMNFEKIISDFEHPKNLFFFFFLILFFQAHVRISCKEWHHNSTMTFFQLENVHILRNWKSSFPFMVLCIVKIFETVQMSSDIVCPS